MGTEQNRRQPVEGRLFLLELHDVTPAHLNEFELMLEWAGELEIKKPLILWVPCWMGKKGMVDRFQLKKRLSTIKHEIVLHGYHHFVPGTVWHRILYGEPLASEFGKLTEPAALTLIEKGKKRVEEWSEKPLEWFCSPRWQQSAGTSKALGKLGFKGYLLRDRIVLLQGVSVPVPVISFDFGSRKLVSFFNRLLRESKKRRVFRRCQPFRLALHPGDMNSSEVLHELKGFAKHLKSEGWKPVTLEEMIAPGEV